MILASYVSPCAENDPNFDDCIKTSLEAAIPFLVKGDPKYHVPSLNPLEVPELKLRSGELEADLTKVKIHGLETVTSVDNLHYDKEGMLITGQITIPVLQIFSDYKLKGRLLVLPIHGEGKFHLKLGKFWIINLLGWILILIFCADKCVVRVSYPLEFKSQSDGSRRLIVKDGEVKYTTTKAVFNFENLFGDKTLSDNMNKVLNDNWEAVLKDLGQAVPVAIEAVVRTVAQGIFRKINF